MHAAIALLQLLLRLFIAPQAREGQAAIVVRSSVGRVGFFGAGKKLLSGGIILVAKCKLAEAGERTGMIRIASEDSLKERFGLVVEMGVKSEFAKLVVGLGLLGLQANGSFKFAAGVFRAQERDIDISKAIVRGCITWTGSEVGFVVALGVAHVLLLGFEARERVKNSGVSGSQLPCCVQSFFSFGKLIEIEGLKATVKLELR